MVPEVGCEPVDYGGQHPDENLSCIRNAGHDAPIEAVLQQRWDITATVYITIIRTLNLIHGIEATRARNIENIFANWSITLQVSDDILDFNADVDSIQNIAVSIARKYP